VDLVLAAIALSVLLLAVLVLRRRYLARSLGAFDLSINRRTEAAAQGWTLGLAVYRGSTLEWYRTFSLRLRPAYRFARDTMTVDGRREPRGAEVHAVHDGHVVVSTSNDTPVQQLALTPAALTGLLAWLEASPPGRSVNTVV
jgi:hypothetical protein